MPNQVDKLAQEADDLHKQLYPEQYPDYVPPAPDPNAPPVPDPTAPPSDEPPTPPVLDSAAPPAPADGTPTEDEPPAPALPVGEPAEPVPPIPPVPHAPDPFEDRYKVLKGKYDAEVPRMASEISILKTQIQHLQSQPPPIPTPPIPASPAPAAALTIKEILSGDPALEEALDTFKTDYPDVADLLVRLTEKAAVVTNKKVNEAVSAVNNQVQSVQEFQAESRTQRFWDVVNSDLPDWQVVRDDPEFASWLSETEPLTGYSRAILMQDALQKLDAHRVLKFYKGFSSGKSSPPPVIYSTPKSTDVPAVPGAALIAPPSGMRAAPSSAPPNIDPPITKAYIQQFYTEAARGAYDGREKEFNTTEARINAAVAKGNVVG